MIIVIVFSAGAFILGLLSGILLNEFIRSKFYGESEHIFWNREAEKPEQEKSEQDKLRT